VASRDIGDTASARLAWVVRFVRENPATWHSATRTANGDRLVAFGKRGFPESLIGGVDLPPPLSAPDIDAIHHEIGTFLRAIVTCAPGQVVSWSIEGSTAGLVRSTAVGAKPAIFASAFGHKDARTAIMQHVRDLVLQAGERLLACPQCRAPFIAIRKQIFCTPECAQRARNARKPPRPRKRG
jgi:hypothetical protein